VDTAYISALSALGGAAIGGLASFGSSWLTQRTQLRFSHHETIKAKREALYAEFVDEASRLYGDALGHQKDDAADLAKLFALLGRIRLASPRPVVTAAGLKHLQAWGERIGSRPGVQKGMKLET
jgi:hypothetical protein